MTDDSVPKREQWWWSEEQLRAAGWERMTTYGRSPKRTEEVLLFHHPNHGAVMPDARAEGIGAWLPEPPPPQEMSDVQVRELRECLRLLSVRLEVESKTVEWAASVLDTAHTMLRLHAAGELQRYDEARHDLRRAMYRRPR